MLKFKYNNSYAFYNDHVSMASSNSSSTINLTTRLRGVRSRRNSLIVEETGRFSTRRSSVPEESFISIAESARSDGRLFRKSTGDICNESQADSVLSPGFLDTQSSTFMQPSGGFSSIFNSTQKLIPSSRDLGDIDDDPNVPSYQGYSNFDDINLSPKEDGEDDIVSDTGTVRIYTTDTARSSSSNFPHIGVAFNRGGTLDFTDLGIPSLNTRNRNFGLGTLTKKKTFEVYKRPKEAKYKRTHWIQFAVAIWSCSFGLHSLVTFPMTIVSGAPHKLYSPGHGISASFMVLVFLVTPLVYVLSAIGQYSGRGPIQAFKMVPSAGGIGLAMFFMSVVAAITKSITASRALAYTVLTFTGMKSIESSENRDWNRPHKSDWFEPSEVYGCKKDPQHVVKSRDWVGPMENHYELCDNSTLEWWAFLGNSADDAIGPPEWRHVIAVFAVWLVVCLSTFKGTRLLFKTLCSTFACILGLMLFLVIYTSIHHERRSLDFQHFRKDLETSGEMARATFTSTALTVVPSIGAIIGLASHNRTHLKLHYIVPVIMAGHMVVLAMSCWIYFGFTDDGFADIWGNLVEYVAFGMVPKFMDKSRAAFYAVMALSELNGVAILALGLVEDLRDNIEWALNHRATVTYGVCLTCAAASLFFTTPGGGRLFNGFFSFVMAPSFYTLGLFTMLTLILTYGLNRFSSNVKKMTGSEMSAISRCYFTGLPLLLIAVIIGSCWISKFYGHYDRMQYPTWFVYMIVTGVLTFVVMVFMCLISCKEEGVAPQFRANPSWPHENTGRPEFRPYHTPSFSKYLSRRGTVHQHVQNMETN